MNDILSQIEEIQSNIREIKSTWSSTIMTLDNIKSGLKSDRKKAVEEAFKKGYDEAQRIYQNPHAESDYQRGLDDAWEAARKIVAGRFSGKLDTGCILNYTASEAIEKIKAYEEQQKAATEIKVGDEIAFHNEDRPDTVVVVTSVGENGFVDGMDGKGTLYAEKNPKNWTKTGRHFPEVTKLLEAMKGEQRDCHTCKHQLVNSINCVDCYGYEKWEPKGGTE